MCTCKECGKKYKVDLIVPDSLWEKIKPKNGGLLCGSCIMEKIEYLSGYDAYKLEKIK